MGDYQQWDVQESLLDADRFEDLPEKGAGSSWPRPDP